MSDNKAPYPFSPVETIRTLCSHSVGPVASLSSIDAVAVVTQCVMAYADLLFEDVKKQHRHGAVFNENTEEPFAVLTDFNGGVIVAWDFDPDETIYSLGKLVFRAQIDVIKWAEITAMALIESGVEEDPGNAWRSFGSRFNL